MGSGSFYGDNDDNGKFNFVIAAPHVWSALEKDEWQARFIEASRALYEATDGQLSFGDIFMADEAWGLAHAEFAVHDFNGTAYATYGGYGSLGQSIQLFKEQRTGDARTIVHEFGHHAFTLGDEYTGPVQQDEIDIDATLPVPGSFNVVPLIQSENDSQSLQYGYAILSFDGQIERLIVTAHTSTQLTVFNAFTQNPQDADGGRIFYQPQYDYTDPQFPLGTVIRCHEDEDANFCLMDHYKDSEAVTEFCSQDNHDPDHDTSHDALHSGKSCWQVIQQVMQDKYGYPLTAPNPAQAGQQTDAWPTFYDLEKEARIALVMDRSGSMGDDNKIQGARFGIDQWITSARQDGDWLSVIWFNGVPETRLPLSQINQPAASIIDDVNNVNPGGSTNIRDSLFEAVDQIQSRDGRAAVQAIVLLTDGIHNTPDDTTIDEVIPTLQDAGIPVYVIALGTPDNVDYGALEELVRETGGSILQVGLLEDEDGILLSEGQQLAAIALDIFKMNLLLRKGLVQVGNQTIAGAPPNSRFSKAIVDAGGRRLPLKELARLQHLDDINGFVKRHRHPHSFTVPFLVEHGASNARFAITYEQKQKFHLYLIDPDGNSVNFTTSSDAVLIAPQSPYATAIVRNPKPGLWHAVVVRASTGPATRVNYSAGVENRMIVVYADCDREVEVCMPTRISANAVWGEQLSGLRVTARLTGPGGSIHNVVLSDETIEEPNSGHYRGVFTPEEHGRYVGEVRIVSRGSVQNAGSIHRAVHAPQKKNEAAQYDLRSKAPVFVRRIPIYFDAGTRPVPKDRDEPRRGRGAPAPVRRRKKGLKPLNIDCVLESVRTRRKI